MLRLSRASWTVLALLTLAGVSCLAPVWSADTPIVVINTTTGRQQQAQAADNALAAGGLKVSGTTSASTSLIGTALFGNGVAATNVAIGGGIANAGTGFGVGAAPNSTTPFNASLAINQPVSFQITSTSAGSNASAQFQATNSGGFTSAVGVNSSGYGSVGILAANAGYLSNNTPNGIAILATNATGYINFSTAGYSEIARLSVAGNLLLGTTADTGITGAGGLRTANTTDATAIGAASVILAGGLSVAKRSFLGTVGATFSGNVEAGVQNATADTAGAVGEVLTASAASVAVAAAGTVGNVTSISVTPGAWVITGSYTINQGATGLTTGSVVNCSIVTTTATNGTQGTTMSQNSALLAAAGFAPMSAPTVTVNISAAATYFLTEQCAFVSGSPTVSGKITAVRIR